MAILTPLPLDTAQAIGAQFGLVVENVRGIREGSVNSNFALAVADAKTVFLRIYEESDTEHARREVELLARLAARGVPTPKPLARTDGGGALSEHAGKPVALFPWIDGAIVCQAGLRPDHLRQVGAALARVHLATANVPRMPPSRFGPARVIDRLERLEADGKLPEDLAPVVASLRAALANAPEPGEDGLIHGDLFRDNVLWTGGALTALLDFESASWGSFAYDLAVVLLAWCYGDDFEPALARALVAGYAAVRPVAEADRRGLFPAAELAALRFTATRICDFELRPRGAGVYKDYRRFLARREALARMGPAGLDELVGFVEARR